MLSLVRPLRDVAPAEIHTEEDGALNIGWERTWRHFMERQSYKLRVTSDYLQKNLTGLCSRPALHTKMLFVHASWVLLFHPCSEYAESFNCVTLSQTVNSPQNASLIIAEISPKKTVCESVNISLHKNISFCLGSCGNNESSTVQCAEL